MSEKQFTITRTFDAPVEEVWAAWTTPSVMATWFHPHGMTTPPESVTADLRPGGRYGYTMVLLEGDVDGRTEWPTGGEYLEVEAPTHLKFTWSDPGDPGAEAPVITIDLAAAGDKTDMTFHLAGIDEDRASEQSVYGGWTEAFEELDDALAAAGAGGPR